MSWIRIIGPIKCSMGHARRLACPKCLGKAGPAAPAPDLHTRCQCHSCHGAGQPPGPKDQGPAGRAGGWRKSRLLTRPRWWNHGVESPTTRDLAVLDPSPALLGVAATAGRLRAPTLQMWTICHCDSEPENSEPFQIWYLDLMYKLCILFSLANLL